MVCDHGAMTDLSTGPGDDHPEDPGISGVTGLRQAANAIDWKLPLMAVDVDGVVAPLDDELSDAWPDITPTRTDGFPMAFSRTMATRLAGVTASRIWLTTWEHNANRFLLSELGWDPLPTLRSAWQLASHPEHPEVPSPPPISGEDWWKLSVLVRLLRFAADDPYDDGLSLPPALIWMDDALDEHPAASSWAESCPFPTLLICPVGGPGLTEDEIALAARFADKHSSP